MSRARSRRTGFTLTEALVSVVLISVGITAALGTMGAISRAQTRAAEGEEMQRLALRKYDEIAAMDALPSGQDQGDFSEINEPRFVWRAERKGTGEGNLDEVRVEVARKGTNFAQAEEIHGLLCRTKSENNP